MSEKRKNKTGRNPKLDPAVFRYTVRFSEEEHNRFLSMFEKSGVYAKSVFLKAHFFGQPFKVLKVDKTLVDECHQTILQLLHHTDGSTLPIHHRLEVSCTVP